MSDGINIQEENKLLNRTTLKWRQRYLHHTCWMQLSHYTYSICM